MSSESNADLAAQLELMRKMMQEQAMQMKAQQEALERERLQRLRREEDLERERAERAQLGASGSSGLTNGELASSSPLLPPPAAGSSGNSSTNSTSDALLVETLRRQLQQRERELREKEEQLKERDDRLSLLTQRSETNSVMSEDGLFMNGANGVFNGVKMQPGGLPLVRASLCQCTEQGYRKCILYKRDVCSCSFSCTFVKEYLKPPKGSSFYLT